MAVSRAEALVCSSPLFYGGVVLRSNHAPGGASVELGYTRKSLKLTSYVLRMKATATVRQLPASPHRHPEVGQAKYCEQGPCGARAGLCR